MFAFFYLLSINVPEEFINWELMIKKEKIPTVDKIGSRRRGKMYM